MQRKMIQTLATAMLLLGCHALTAAGTSPGKVDAGWLQLEFAQGRFRIRMPAVPQVRTVSSESEYGPLECTLYVCEAAGGDVFVVSHVDFPPEAFEFGADQVLLRLRAGFVKACGGRVVSERSIMVDGQTGQEATIEGPDGSVAVWRGYVVGGRVYQLVVRVKGTADLRAPGVQRFVESFGLLPEHRVKP